MKRTKREENSIIIHFTFYFVGFIGLIIYFLASILPWMNKIEEGKDSLSKTYTELERVILSWPNFEEFKSHISSTSANSNDLYTKEVLDNIDDKFYNNLLVNNSGSINYSDYLKILEDKYSDRNDYQKKLNITSNILPYYSEIHTDWKIDVLTDYKFINYIESIIETFNVSSNDPIWIKDLEVAEWYAVNIWDSSLETSIFYIPLDLTVSWTKESILNFIYYIENVWNVNINNDNLNVSKNIDKDFIWFSNKILKWQRPVENYNIFNNQIIDIKRLELPEYIDSSFDPLDNNKSVILNVLETQWREKYKAKVSLRFYVKWIPVYILENYIDNVIKKYWESKIDIIKKLSDPNISSQKRNRIMEIQKELVQLWKSKVAEIQKSKVSKVNIDKAYKEAYILDSTLDNYLNELK